MDKKLFALLAAQVFLVAGPSLSAAERNGLDISFARGQWRTNDFIVVKGPLWPYVHSFDQRDEAIVNPCPDVTGEEIQKKYGNKVYAAMVHRNRFAFDCTVSSTMMFDYRMAPILVFAPELGKTADGTPEFREHWEVCLFDEGINVWHHFFEDGKLVYRRAAALQFRGKARYGANVRHEVRVVLRREKGHKRMIVVCGDYELSLTDDSLPDTFQVGVLGCEGRNFFYDLKVR